MSLATFAGLAQAAVQAAQAAPVLASGGGVEVGWWRVVGALLVCLLLAVGAAFALRHRLGSNGAALFRRPEDLRMQLLERLSLGPQGSLCLVKIDGREFAVVLGAGGSSLIPLEQSASAPA